MDEWIWSTYSKFPARLQSDEAISAHANLAEDSTKVAWTKNTAA